MIVWVNITFYWMTSFKHIYIPRLELKKGWTSVLHCDLSLDSCIIVVDLNVIYNDSYLQSVSPFCDYRSLSQW